jgi:hypothetical protein
MHQSAAQQLAADQIGSRVDVVTSERLDQQRIQVGSEAGVTDLFLEVRLELSTRDCCPGRTQIVAEGLDDPRAIWAQSRHPEPQIKKVSPLSALEESAELGPEDLGCFEGEDIGAAAEPGIVDAVRQPDPIRPGVDLAGVDLDLHPDAADASSGRRIELHVHDFRSLLVARFRIS